MSTITGPGSRSTAVVVRTEARLFGRELGSLFWIVAFPTSLLAILGSVPSLREPIPELGGQRVVDLYASVSVLLAMIVASLMSMPPVIAGYRERGILRRLRTTPVHPGSLLLAQVGLHAAAVLGAALLVLTYGRVVLDVTLPAAAGWYVLSLLLATVAAFSVGALVTSVAGSSRSVQTLGMVFFFPSMFAAGVYLPVQTMPGLLHDIVVATPMGAAAEALNDSLVGRVPELVDLAVMAGWSAVLGLLAVRFFRWE